MVILSFAAIFTKWAEFDLSATATVFNRYWLGTIALLMWQGVDLLGWGRSSGPLSPDSVFPLLQDRNWLWFALEVMCSLLCVWLWAVSLQSTSIATANLFHNLGPLFTSLGGWIFLRQHFDRSFWLALLLALLGAVGLGWQDWQTQGEVSLLGDSLALASALFYALTFLLREQLRRTLTTRTILFWSCAVRSLICLGGIWIQGDRPFPITTSGWLAVLGLGLLVQVGGQGLLTYSLKTFSASFTSLCMLLDPVLTALFAWGLFGEILTPWDWGFFMLILGGIYLASRSSGATANPQTQAIPR